MNQRQSGWSPDIKKVFADMGGRPQIELVRITEAPGITFVGLAAGDVICIEVLIAPIRHVKVR
jgi:hypothetical protein